MSIFNVGDIVARIYPVRVVGMEYKVTRVLDNNIIAVEDKWGEEHAFYESDCVGLITHTEVIHG